MPTNGQAGGGGRFDHRTPPTKIAPIGPTSPGAALNGGYNITTVVVAPSGKTYAPQKYTGRFQTHCLRTGDRCASVWITDIVPSQIYLYANGQWNWSYTSAPRSCDPSKPADGRRTFVDIRQTLNRTDPGDGPAQKLVGRESQTFHGDCPITYELTLNITRTGD